MNDPFDLRRFVDAQQDTHAQAVRELAAGRKTSHWMWFVFPQLRGLGHSQMATRFGITSLDEARAYLAHALLGPRLEECVQLTLRIDGRSITDILGPPDDMKFRSCMTLFEAAAPTRTMFAEALQKYFAAIPDARTLELLRQQDRLRLQDPNG
jgi:uncharacterized protein (DUF1810 family)